MASGFVQRFKGKIQAQCIFVGLDGLRQSVVQSSAATSTAVNVLQNAGLSLIVGSSGSAVFTLEAPLPGVEKQITMSTLSSGAIIASTSATFDGTNPVIAFKSTLGSVGFASVNLIGMSTARWSVLSVYPSTMSGVSILLQATT